MNYEDHAPEANARAGSFVAPPDATSKSRKQKWHRGSTNKRGESQGWDGGDGVARRPYHQRFANAPWENRVKNAGLPPRRKRDRVAVSIHELGPF